MKTTTTIHPFTIFYNSATHYLNLIIEQGKQSNNAIDSVVTAAMYAGMAMNSANTEVEDQQAVELVTQILTAAQRLPV